MNMRVQMASWPSAVWGLSSWESPVIHLSPSTEALPWLAKRDGSLSGPTNTTASPRLPTHAWRPKVSPSGPALSCVAPSPTSPPTSASRTNSAATPTPSPAGATASSTTASRVCATSRGAAARGLFPPEERHQVVVLATTQPADTGVPVSHWSLEDLALKILQDAHYRDMSRSTIQRILAQADLKPHKCRSWLHREDDAFEEKALAICQLYLAAPRLYQQGELVLCCDEKTGIQALERKHPTKPMQPGRPALQECEYIRHGTRCLLATFVVPTGLVYGDVTARRTKPDFRRHLRHTVAWLEAMYPRAQNYHWVMDNLNTHWSLEVCALFARLNGLKYEPKKLQRGRERIAFLTAPGHRHVIHFTPKHGSWLNQVE